MKNVSQSFKENIKKYGRQLDSRITIGSSIIGKQDINSIIPSFHTSLFKTVMHSFEIDCNLFIPKDEIINISIGVKFGNSGYEYIEYENFKVKSCEKQEDTESFKIIAYDKIMESMIDYDLELTQEMSLREYLIKIFERLSWSTEGVPVTFINSTKQIDPSVHIGIGYTFRDVLDEIATITGSFIYIKNNVPTLGYITETNETIDEEYLSQDDVTIGEKFLINSLVFSRAEESDNIFRKDDNSIAENGLYEFRIEDNQIISTNERDSYIDELFNYLKTLQFYIYDVKSTGIMWLDICDRFTFNIHGSKYSTIILNDEITVDQDIEELLYVERPEETEADYKCADTTDKRINQAYILVNKQKQEITQRVSVVEGSINNLTNTKGEAEGKNIHIEDSAEESLVDISLHGKSIQDREPTPDNPVEIENVEGNVEVKVEGKNLFNNNYNEYTRPTDYWIYPIKLEKGKTYTLSAVLPSTPMTNVAVGVARDGNKYSEFVSAGIFFCVSSSGASAQTQKFTVNDTFKNPKLVIYSPIKSNIPEILSSYKVQLEEGQPTEYEPYKSQIAYFPLAEGQKLMEGSYLADDGVHNVRKQVVLDGSDDENWTANGTSQGYGIVIGNIGGNTNGTIASDVLCNKLTCVPQNKVFNGSAINGVASLGGTVNKIYVRFDSSITTVTLLRSKLAENPITVEYELTEEEIVPYTEEQQEAWNKIKALTTYKNITNITSEAYAKIVYMRDNGLDVYETKQNADKRYTETTEKFAETKITTDGIKDTVSQTQTMVGNNYNELKTKFDDYAPKSDVVSLQTSVEKIQTDTYTKTEINTKLIDGSVEKVSTTAGTFDENGLTIEKTNAKTKGNFNEKGITVMDATSGNSQELLFAGYDEEINETIVRSKNMTVEKYFVIGNTARQENYINPVLGGKSVGVFIL